MIVALEKGHNPKERLDEPLSETRFNAASFGRNPLTNLTTKALRNVHHSQILPGRQVSSAKTSLYRR